MLQLQEINNHSQRLPHLKNINLGILLPRLQKQADQVEKLILLIRWGIQPKQSLKKLMQRDQSVQVKKQVLQHRQGTPQEKNTEKQEQLYQANPVKAMVLLHPQGTPPKKVKIKQSNK